MSHTPGPWKWWTSNSWKRLKRDDRGITQNVLEPYVMRDGCADVSITEADMRLIEAAPDLLSVLRKARMHIANNGAFRSKEEMLREIEAVMDRAAQRCEYSEGDKG